MKINTALFIWLVPSETRNGAKNQDLYNIRHKLWYQIRYVHRCAPIDHSVYLITDSKQIPQLRQLAQEFKAEYEQLGFKAMIDVVEYERNIEDLSAMLEMAFMQILAQRIQSFDKAKEEGKTVSRSTIKKAQEDIAWIKSDCQKFNINSDRINAFLDILSEKINEHSKRLGKSQTTVEWKFE
jgi:hypothetical protein